jgi:hypothetical protein
MRPNFDFSDTPAFDLDGWMIAWNAADERLAKKTGPGAVKVGPWPDKANWSHDYTSTSGCCISDWHKLSRDQKLQELVNGFFVLVLSDGLD